MAANKEKIYDNQIAPLMTEIINICQENKIAFIASFSTSTGRPEDKDLVCTTAFLDEYTNPPKEFRNALRCIYTPPSGQET